MTFDIYPKYYRNALIRSSPTGFIGIATFWLKKETVYNTLTEESKSKTLIIGNLYTPQGIKYIMQNTLLCPQMNYIIFITTDDNGTPTDKNHVIDDLNKHITFDIEYEDIFWNYFNSNHIIYCSLSNINDIINSLHKLEPWIEQPLMSTEPEIQNTPSYESEHIGFIIRDSNLLRLWKRILTKINYFGCVKSSSYDNQQKELLGVMSILTAEAKLDNEMPNVSIIDDYIPQVTEPYIKSCTSYTYGSRLHDNDQITNIINDLKSCEHSRRAISVTWNSAIDSLNPSPPCLVLIDMKIQNDYVYMTCYFRSHDIYNAYCMNVYALQKLQIKIINAIANDKLKLGSIAIVSNSAHVYERDFDKLVNMQSLDCNLDSRGYFLIDLNRETKEICVTLMDTGNNIVRTFKHTKVHALRDLIQPFISEISHATYMGSELMKAKYCIRYGLEYKQS